MELRRFFSAHRKKFVASAALLAASAGLVGTLTWAQVSPQVAGAYIDVDQDALEVPYGIWVETEVQLKNAPGGDINWGILDSTIPEGLSLEDTRDSKILIWGTPKFTGLWCFTLGAKTGNSVVAEKRLCFAGQDGEGDDVVLHPRFKTDRYLPNATVGTSYQAEVDVELESDTTTYTGSHYDGVLPDGLDIESRDSDSQFVIWGTPTRVGSQEFVLMLEDDQGRQTYRQFQITVEDKADVAPSCPPGYYYDDTINRCVQERLDTCPEGTYFDPDSDSCLRYPTPPPTVYCPPNTYFDPFTSQCVYESFPRCPINYQWSTYYDRCIRESYSCPIGYRYSWSERRCERTWRDECPGNSYWDSYYNRCVRYERGCHNGEFWDPRSQSCRRAERGCHDGEYYDPNSNRCRSRRPDCGSGTHYDSRTDRCERNQPPRPSCGPGTHYDARRNACVGNSNPRPRPPRPMPPMNPRPMPMNPPPPPMPMPMNPPQPPRPMNPPPMNPPMNPPPQPPRPMNPPP
ncbi:MAG: Ig domain-containing protein, partial [Bdellovibrionota bacterium]